MAADIQARYSNRNLMVVSPDVGGVVRARSLAKRLDNAAAGDRRQAPRTRRRVEVMNIIGDVEGHCCVLVDDIVDSAGTLCNAAAALKEQGATEVIAYCSHGVLSGAAEARVAASVLTELVVTDSIYREGLSEGGKIRRLTIAPLFGEAIHRIADESLSEPLRLTYSPLEGGENANAALGQTVGVVEVCNLYRLHKGTDAIRQIFAGLGHQLSFPRAFPTLRRRTSASPIRGRSCAWDKMGWRW